MVKLKLENFGNKPISQKYNFYLFIKNIFDRLLAFSLLIFLAPIYLFISIGILIKLGIPIFFIQKRAGLYGEDIFILKFRTMKNDRDINGMLLSDEVRLTKFGSFLRNFSLDELPSILNILKGDMSFVGPRPLKYPASIYDEFQIQRLSLKQGLTGWAQINGRNSISWEEKFDLDIWYVENINFILDLKILFITVWKVLFKKDINSKNSASMPVFKGTKNINIEK